MHCQQPVYHEITQSIYCWMQLLRNYYMRIFTLIVALGGSVRVSGIPLLTVASMRKAQMRTGRAVRVILDPCSCATVTKLNS